MRGTISHYPSSSMKRASRTVVRCLAVAVATFVLAACSAGPRSSEKRASSDTLVLSGATIYPSPSEASVSDGVVVVRAGKIVAAGRRDAVAIPPGATILDCGGQFLVAGFQNSHVHFLEPKWSGAQALPAAQLSRQFEDIALRWGYTTVVDTGSELANTVALRDRVASGEATGPRILTTGTPFYPVDGIPIYLKDSLPPALLALLNTPSTEGESASIAARQIEAGADAIKLFTGSVMGRGRVKVMSSPVVRAAADEAHRRGRLVFAHATNVEGLEVALDARVDVMAHALDDRDGFRDEHIERMKAGGMAMIPTLKLFGQRSDIDETRRHVGAFARAGGQILFGTDAGYLDDYDPGDEYALMAGAGLSWREVLASLTTAPAERFGEAGRRGRVATGMDADLVLLDADPAADPAAFAKVRRTVRGGRIVYEARR